MIIPGIDTTLLFVGKILALIAIGIYGVFALVVIKQVYMMIDTLDVGFTIIIKAVAWIHLAFVVFVFLTALTIL